MKLTRHNNTNWTLRLTDDEMKQIYVDTIHNKSISTQIKMTHQIKTQLAEFNTNITHWLASMEK